MFSHKHSLRQDEQKKRLGNNQRKDKQTVKGKTCKQEETILPNNKRDY